MLDPLNLATPTIRNRIEELREKVGPTAPAPTPAPSLEGEGLGHAPMGGGSIADIPDRPIAPAQPVEEDREGWLGSGDDDDWFEPER